MNNDIIQDVKGLLIDKNTRCNHYQSTLDIIAIKFKCCHTYYACIYCHHEVAGHLPNVWAKNEFNEKAILCGNCKHQMTINQYLKCGYQCPNCKASFNPKCINHNHFYFET